MIRRGSGPASSGDFPQPRQKALRDQQWFLLHSEDGPSGQQQAYLASEFSQRVPLAWPCICEGRAGNAGGFVEQYAQGRVAERADVAPGVGIRDIWRQAAADDGVRTIDTHQHFTQPALAVCAYAQRLRLIWIRVGAAFMQNLQMECTQGAQGSGQRAR